MKDLSHIDLYIDNLERAVEVMAGVRENRVLIEEALTHGWGTHSFDDVVDLIGKAELHWRDFDKCFFVVQVQEYPRAKHYHVWLSGGSMNAIEESIPTLAVEAKEWGCDRITVCGRMGWKRILQKHGAYAAQQLMGMEV